MMNSGRHRIGHGHNGSKPVHRFAELDELLNPSSVATDQRPMASGNGAATHDPAATHATNGSVAHPVGLVGNGNGHGPPTNPTHGEDVAQTRMERSAATLPHGIGLIRFGAREMATGLADLPRSGLETLHRHLPGRLRTISQRRLGVVLVVVLALIVGVVAVPASTVLGRLEGPTSVVVATSGPTVINNEPGGVGSISAAPQDVATVSLNVQGVNAPIQITAVDVLANQQVAAGTPLLQLNPIPFEQNILQVKTTLEQSEQALASAQSAESNSAAASNGYLAVQVPTLAGEVALNKQLLQIAQGNSTYITSPITGYVSAVRVVPGQVVSPGNTLVQVVNPSQIVVNAGMQLTDLQTIVVGDRATITPSQLPGVHLHGTVAAVSPSATGDGLEGTVVVEAPNLAVHPVPIGTQSIVNVSAPLHAAVSVPTLAVLNVQIAPVVGVIRHNRIHFQPVQIGASDGTRTQIISGLRPGEQVAVTNMQVLTDGDKVTVSSGGT